ncbi:MAG: Fur family transcriptional regulator [Christensenellales bacterium]
MKTARRYSRKRDAILETIASTKSHPSAEWVYNKLKPKFPDLSLGTVYRNIAQFKDEGRIICVGVVAGQERYDANVQPHLHFVCENCSEVIDVEVEYCSDDLAKRVEDKYGFKVSSHETIVYGKCADCVRNTSGDS